MFKKDLVIYFVEQLWTAASELWTSLASATDEFRGGEVMLMEPIPIAELKQNHLEKKFSKAGRLIPSVHSFAVINLGPKQWTLFSVLYLLYKDRFSPSYRTQSIDLQSKSMDWFLYDMEILFIYRRTQVRGIPYSSIFYAVKRIKKV